MCDPILRGVTLEYLFRTSKHKVNWRKMGHCIKKFYAAYMLRATRNFSGIQCECILRNIRSGKKKKKFNAADGEIRTRDPLLTRQVQ